MTRAHNLMFIQMVLVSATLLLAPARAQCQPGCRAKVATKALPESALTLALDPAKLPKQVCRAADGAYTWTWAGSEYRYRAQRAPGGGNARGTQYSLDIAPPSTAGLRTPTFAFLACQVPFAAHRYCAWRLAVRPAADALHLSADDVAQACKPAFTWASMMRDLAAHFRSCELAVTVE